MRFKMYSWLIGMLFVPTLLLAQTEPEDVAAVDDKFQNFFTNLSSKKASRTMTKPLKLCKDAKNSNLIML